MSYHRVSPLERAFQIARAGTVKNINGIKILLAKEGYFIGQIVGPTLYKQLMDIIQSKKN